MQESFGLTPIEAMAAGLPRVISDWDGYRDSVRHGEDGFLVTTRQPPAGTGGALADLLLSGLEMYGGFLAKTALSVSIDQEMAADCIAKLIRDKSLRRSMAEKARIRAREVYDWKNIIPTYEAFWGEMSAQRKRDRMGVEKTKWASLPPQAPDPFTMYATYPTEALDTQHRVSVVASADQIKLLFRHEVNVFGMDMMIPPEETTKLISAISKLGEPSIGDLLQKIPALDQNQLWRTLGWLIKLGILRYAG